MHNYNLITYGVIDSRDTREVLGRLQSRMNPDNNCRVRFMFWNSLQQGSIAYWYHGNWCKVSDNFDRLDNESYDAMLMRMADILAAFMSIS
jgi:hypothetical protein